MTIRLLYKFTQKTAAQLYPPYPTPQHSATHCSRIKELLTTLTNTPQVGHPQCSYHQQTQQTTLLQLTNKGIDRTAGETDQIPTAQPSTHLQTPTPVQIYTRTAPQTTHLNTPTGLYKYFFLHSSMNWKVLLECSVKSKAHHASTVLTQLQPEQVLSSRLQTGRCSITGWLALMLKHVHVHIYK